MPDLRQIASTEAFKRLENAFRYDAALGMADIPPNGDDFNAVMEMMRGEPFRPPHLEGR